MVFGNILIWALYPSLKRASPAMATLRTPLRAFDIGFDVASSSTDIIFLLSSCCLRSTEIWVSLAVELSWAAAIVVWCSAVGSVDSDKIKTSCFLHAVLHHRMNLFNNGNISIYSPAPMAAHDESTMPPQSRACRSLFLILRRSTSSDHKHQEQKHMGLKGQSTSWIAPGRSARLRTRPRAIPAVAPVWVESPTQWQADPIRKSLFEDRMWNRFCYYYSSWVVLPFIEPACVVRTSSRWP